MIDHDDEPPMSDAEIHAWWESEKLFADVERAFAKISGGMPDEDQERRELAEAFFTLGVMAFERDILKGRRRRESALAKLPAAERARKQKTADRDRELRASIADYLRRHPGASDRRVADHLARRSGAPPGTVRDRIRRLKRRG